MHSTLDGDRKRFWWVSCVGECKDFHYDATDTEPAAIAAWNRRAPTMNNAPQSAQTRDWQPIATAPKDGSDVLVTGDDWLQAGFAWYGEARGITAWHPRGELETFEDEQPTHWLALPALPASPTTTSNTD